MSKKRLYEIAKEVGVESKVVVAKAQELGLSVKSHSSSVEEADANRIASSLKGEQLRLKVSQLLKRHQLLKRKR